MSLMRSGWHTISLGDKQTKGDTRSVVAQTAEEKWKAAAQCKAKEKEQVDELEIQKAMAACR